MKRALSILFAGLFLIPCSSWGAVSVKKAAPVATKQSDKMADATSLLPTVIGLVGSVKQLKAQQQQLSADCAPTSDEISVVNDLVKEWAKIGDVDSVTLRTSFTPCPASGFSDYMLDAEGNEICFEIFSDRENYIWSGYPKASRAEICEDGKNCKYVSNVYEVFGKIPFTDEDYTVREMGKITKLRAKYERCAPAKVKAAQRELAGSFLTGTLGSIGQTTGAAGTGTVINSVSAMGGSGGIGSMLQAFTPMATQMMDK